MATNPYIYVDTSNGTNTGGTDVSFAALQTSSMAAIEAANAGDVYDSLVSAITGCSPDDGQYVFIANDSATSGSGGITIGGSTVLTGAGVSIISVDTTAVDQYLPGAVENLIGGADVSFFGNVLSYGVTWEVGDDLRNSTSNARVVLADCTLLATGPTDLALHADSWSMWHGYNLTFKAGNTSADMIKCDDRSSEVNLFDCDFDSAIVPVFIIPASNIGIIRFTGCDFTGMTGTLIESYGSVGTAPESLTRLTDCILDASLTLPSTPTNPGHRFEMYGSDVSGGDQHRFQITDYSGTAKNNDAIYVTDTEVWIYDGSSKSSIEIVTTANCSSVQPFRFSLPAEYLNLATASNDVIDIYITSDTTLTQADITILMEYADGTTALQPNWVSSSPTDATNLLPDPLMSAGLTTGTALATTTGKWSGTAKTNQYKLTLDTTGDAGGKGAPLIHIEVYKASLTAYIDTEISAKA